MQFVLDEIDAVDDPVLRADLLRTLRETSDRGFFRGRRKAIYEMKADRYRLTDIAEIVHVDKSLVSREVAAYAEENGLPIPKKVPQPESVWGPALALGRSRLRSSRASTPTTP